MIKRILKHSSVYFFSSIFVKIIGFILLPVITAKLTVDDFGLYSNLKSIINVLSIFASFSFDVAYGRYIYEYEKVSDGPKILTSTVLNLLILWAIVFIPISAFVVSKILISWKSERIFVALLLPLIAISQQMIAIGNANFQSRHKTKLVVSLNTILYISLQVLSLIFLFVFNYGSSGLLLSQYIINTVNLIYIFVKFFKDGLFSFNTFSFPVIKKIYRYALGFLPVNFSSWIFNLSDKIIISYFISLSATGKYSLFVQLISIIPITIQSIVVVFNPYFYRSMNERKNTEDIKRYFTIMIILLNYMLISVSLLLPVIVKVFFIESYQENFEIIPLIALGTIFLSLRKIYSVVIAFYKKAVLFSLTGYIPAVVNLVLNLILIPIYGISAAAWSTMISYAFYGVSVFLISNRLHKFEIPLVRLLIMFFFAVIVAFASVRIDPISIKILLWLICTFGILIVTKRMGLFVWRADV
ncbi:MAG: oligosaccharide flippase family protein [Spirochaetales bacterium]|nr:oligosaccharide flippase family protein [Spirochaetales bacterium]